MPISWSEMSKLEIHRADHILENHIDNLLETDKETKKLSDKEINVLLELRSKAEALEEKELCETLRKLNVKALGTEMK